MRRAEPDTTYSYTSAANPVTFTVAPGETFQVDTVPTCGRQFDTHTGRYDPDSPGAINASTGCIAVEGASPGGVLIVHVLDIQLHEFGYTRLGWPSAILPRLATEDGWEKGFKAVRLRDGFVEWSPRLKIPLAPMIGYDQAAAIAKESFQTGRTVREICREQGILPEAELEQALDPWRMTRPVDG